MRRELLDDGGRGRWAAGAGEWWSAPLNPGPHRLYGLCTGRAESSIRPWRPASPLPLRLCSAGRLRRVGHAGALQDPHRVRPPLPCPLHAQHAHQVGSGKHDSVHGTSHAACLQGQSWAALLLRTRQGGGRGGAGHLVSIAWPCRSCPPAHDFGHPTSPSLHMLLLLLRALPE